MPPEAALVVGDGNVGRAIEGELIGAGGEVWSTTRRRERVGGRVKYLDLASPAEEWSLPEGCSVAFLCAAVTRLDACEREPEATRWINVTQTVEMARRLLERGVHPVFPSTNLVFDGSIPFTPMDSPPTPRTEYGRQKADAERALLELGTAVLRMSKVVEAGKGLFQDWVERLRGGQPVQAFGDMMCSPVPGSTIADLIVRIAEQKSSGIFQISGDRDISYAEIARRLAKEVQADPALVHEAAVERVLGLGVPIPQNTTLDSGRVGSCFGIVTPNVLSTVDALAAG